MTKVEEEYTKIRINFRTAKRCENCIRFDDYENQCDKYGFNVGAYNVCDDWR